jgi:3-oxoacyl-[acyl-carrier protein] reductase
MEFDFQGRVAIVTGAAHGFGRAICVQLARRGAEVWACDLRDDELAETAQACAAQGGKCTVLNVNVASGRETQSFVAEVLSATDRVDILVNNAGGVVGQTGQPIENVGDDDWHAIFRVNLDGAFYMARAVAPAMKSQRYGRIVNISSGAGRSISLTGIQAYASAKAGQIGLTRQLAHELGPWGITANNIAPGFVLSNPSTQKQWESYGPDGQRELVESMALKRLGTAEDIAYGVLYFASDYAAWCTGQVLSIDGGSAMF